MSYFKKTDRNAFIPLGSCHHDSWLKSVPKSQFVRMRRNCTEMDDYIFQAGIIKNRLQEKGYDPESLQDTIEEVANIDRSVLLEGGPRKAKDRPAIPFITTFSTQHQLIKKIIRKHWHQLGNDRIIQTFLPVNPQVIFRGVPSLRDRVAPNVVDPPTKRI